MCGVFGFLRYGVDSIKDPSNVDVQLVDLSKKAIERGRDSWGIVSVDDSGHCNNRKGAGIFSSNWEHLGLVTSGTRVVIGSTRAEPTTEYVCEKRTDDIGPFFGCHYIVAHNGTIANDHELIDAYGFTPATQIDSAVLPHLYDTLGIEEGTARVMGSYTIASIDVRHPHQLHLLRNYKPLAYRYDPAAEVVWFASSPDWLEDSAYKYSPDYSHAVIPDPFTHLIIDGIGKTVEARPIEYLSPNPRRVLVVASGGLDSTVAAALLVRKGCEVHLLHFDYACHASAQEAHAVREVAADLGIGATFFDLGWLGQLGGSNLTEHGLPISEGVAGAEYPHEWVPARNMVMIAAACAMADARGYDTIALGTNLEEGGAFADNTQEFLKTMNAASNLGTRARARIISPVGDLMKHEIVKLGLEIHAPLDRTWSCYRSGEIHCGHCGPCYMRRTAFTMAGSRDPINYLDENPRCLEKTA